MAEQSVEPTPVPEQRPFQQHCFSRQDADGRDVHFQVLNLGRQLYIWVSTSGEMNNLALAMPTAAQSSAVPPSTQLLQGKGADAAQGVARRLTLRCRQPVAVSWNIEGDELLHLWAEKELVSELKVLDLVAQSDGLSVS